MNQNTPSQPNQTFIPELLAPAGSLDKLKIAAHYGADAVYMGGSQYSLRAHAVLDRDKLAEAVRYAHQQKIKVYITVNIMAHNRDLEDLPNYLSFLEEIGADGLIISDPGIFAIARRSVPNLPIHVSTQANITNKESALFWQNQGAERVNLARELSCEEIKQIRQNVALKLEIFVHGAICISYSGRCSLSLYMTDRDANLGNCAHPCRYRYQLQEEKRPGLYFPVEEDHHGTYLFNSKDLCLLNRLPELIKAGANSIKLEGRMKSIYYVGAVVRLYRAALDFIRDTIDKNGPQCLDTLTMPAHFSAELPKIGSRGYTENFFDNPPKQNDMLYDGAKSHQTHVPVGIVRDISGEHPLIDIRNPLTTGDSIEYLGAGLEQHQLTVTEMINDKNNVIVTRANPGNLIHLQTSPDLKNWQVLGLLRKAADQL